MKRHPPRLVLGGWLSLSLLAWSGCDGGGNTQPAAGRTVGVVASKSSFDPEAFCEVYRSEAEAKAIRYPGLVGSRSSPKTTRWVNVWATWCAPCVEELPRLRDWEHKLGDEPGIGGIELMLLAADDPDLVAQFMDTHPAAAGSLRWEDPGAIEAWLESNGLPTSSVLPIHMFVDRRDRLRCLRMGGVSGEDYDRVRELLRLLDE